MLVHTSVTGANNKIMPSNVHDFTKKKSWNNSLDDDMFQGINIFFDKFH